MTREFSEHIDCPVCGERFPAETAFRRWMRAHPSLDSGDGMAVCDADLWIHKWKSHGTREVQCLMMVELKTHNAPMSMSQRDTLLFVNACLRNRRRTPTNRKLYGQAQQVPLKMRSHLSDRMVFMRLFGVHRLLLSGTDPENSATIQWDRHFVSVDQLIKLLRFDLDPDTLKPLDLRRHHRVTKHRTLFDEV